MPSEPSFLSPIERACLSLEGLSIGDAFGQQFFGIVALSAAGIPSVWRQSRESLP